MQVCVRRLEELTSWTNTYRNMYTKIDLRGLGVQTRYSKFNVAANFLPVIFLTASPGRIKQTVYSRRWGRVEETGGPAHSDGVAICRSSNA